MTVEERQERVRLAASACALDGEDGFEVLAISAGEGNGWFFDADVLRASLGLWEGVESFIDHASRAVEEQRSLRDLAGVCRSPRFDESARGILVRLKPGGPAAGLLRALGREWLASPQPRPRIGFSADLLFSAVGNRVERILKVLSLDVVVNPARGGAFLRLLNAAPELMEQGFQEKENSMEQSKTEEGRRNLPDYGMPFVGKPECTGLGCAGLRQGTPFVGAPDTGGSAIPDLPKQEPAEALRLQLCASLLESTLNGAGLPAAMNERLRGQFGGRVFEQAELQSALDDARGLVSELSGGTVVRGAGRISEMTSASDQLTAAVYDMLGAERPAPQKNTQAARLSGIRELYLLATGDHGFTGGMNTERARFAAVSDLPGLLKNTLNKLVLMQWEELGRAGYRWWEPVVSVEHFNSLHDLTGVLVGEVSVLPSVSEGAAYTELDIADSAETGTWGKYGGYIGLTLEMFERDETHKLRQYPKKLASAALRRISALVAEVFTSSSGTGPLMADTYHVFEAAHHANLGTAALSSAAWEAAGKAIYNQSMVIASGGTAPKLALDARYLLVPRDLRLTGMRILYPSFERESSIFSENMQKGSMGDVITVPEFTDANDWAAAADPRLAPAIVVGERFGILPEIFIADSPVNGALFTNDELRMKVRHWVSVFVADHRPLYKSNVA